VIALVVTTEGLPLAYEVLPGNTADSKTLRTFLSKIEKQYGKARRVWVMDRGVPTEAVLAEMRASDHPCNISWERPRDGSIITILTSGMRAVADRAGSRWSMLGNEVLYDAALSERGCILAAARSFAPMGREESVSPLRLESTGRLRADRSLDPNESTFRDARPGVDRFRADSLFGRINSLFVANRFPVVAELIPCSVAQGISSRQSRKSLDSQMFSGRIFARERRNPTKFAVVSLLAGAPLHSRATRPACPASGVLSLARYIPRFSLTRST